MAKIHVLVVYNNSDVRVINVLRKLDEAREWKERVDIHLKEIAVTRDFKKYIESHMDELTGLGIPTDLEFTNSDIIQAKIQDKFTVPMEREVETIK